MKVIKLILPLIILAFICNEITAKELQNFAYQETNIREYQFDKKAIITAKRDSDGNAFVLELKIINDVKYYHLFKIDINQKKIWSNLLQTSTAPDTEALFSDLTLSPQGNIALTFLIKGKIQGPKGKKWEAIKQDALYLFIDNYDGHLLKDIHLKGKEDEFNAKVVFGTGGEVFLHAKTKSEKVSYLNENYTFRLKTDKQIVRDLVLSLSPTFSTRWARSVEPSTLEGIRLYKDNLLVAFFNYSSNFSIYKKTGFVKNFKNYTRKNRGAVLTFNDQGNKNWVTKFTHPRNSINLSSIKVYPKGNIGVSGTFNKSFYIDNKHTINQLSTPTIGGNFFSVSLDDHGSVENELVLKSKLSIHIGDQGANHTMLTFRTDKKTKNEGVYFRSRGSGNGVLYSSYDESCKNHFFINDELKPIYKENGGQCFNKSRLWYRLSEGKIKYFVLKKRLTYAEVPYGKDEENEEEIPGLAFKPKFYHGDPSLNSKAILSYAIAENSERALVYFPPKGMKQREFLANSLVQATLNSAYFRGFSIFVLSSHEIISTYLVENYFSPLEERDFFKKLKYWHVVGYEDRAMDLINTYDKSIKISEAPYFNNMSMSLYFPEIPPESMGSEEAMAKMASKLPATYVVTGIKDLELRKRMRVLQKTFLEYGTDFSHIHSNGTPITKRSFSALNSYGEDKSRRIYKSLQKAFCLDSKGLLNTDPRENDFLKKCVKEGLPLSQQDESSLAAEKDFIQHMEVLYGYEGHTPYFDPEYFEFIGYIKENHVVQKKKRGGDTNSVLR